MKMMLAFGLAIGLFGATTPSQAQVVTYYYPPSVPVTTYYAPAAVPTTTYYAPSIAGPVTAYYAPPAAYTSYYAPATVAVPVTTYYAPARSVVYAPYGVRYRYYVPGQPIRNIFR